MDDFFKQQTTDEFLKEMFSELREYLFSQVSLVDSAGLGSIDQILTSNGKTTALLTGETVKTFQYAGDATQFQKISGTEPQRSYISPATEVRDFKKR
jgi:hypothetical protein